MKEITVTVEKLRNSWIARIGLGTCGHWPFQWDATLGKNPNDALKSFMRKHKRNLKAYRVKTKIYR